MAILGSPTSHLRFSLPENSTSVRRNIYLALDTGEPATGITLAEFTVADAAEFGYFRDDASAAVDSKFDGTSAFDDATTLGTWENNCIKEISAALMPGWYEISFPDAAFVETTNGVGQANVVFSIVADDTATIQDVQVTFELTKGDAMVNVQREEIIEGTTSALIHIHLQKNDGTPATGLSKTDYTVAAESQFAYKRSDAAAAVDAALNGTDTIGDTTTLGTWITSSFKEVSSTLMPGLYELGLPDAALVVGSEHPSTVEFSIIADKNSNVQPLRVEVQLLEAVVGEIAPAPVVREHVFVEKANAVNVRKLVYIELSGGGGATGLDKNAFTVADAGEFAYYRGDASAAVNAAFDGTTALDDTTTLGTWESAAVKEVSSTLMPGWYEVGFPNAAFIINQTSGVKPRWVNFLIKPDDTAVSEPVLCRFDLLRSIAR